MQHQLCLFKKKDESICICGDFRKINQVLLETIYPIPHMADILTKVAGHKFYSKIDLKNAYLQIKIGNKSQKYLVINTHFGIFRYTPKIFQKYIE